MCAWMEAAKFVAVFLLGLAGFEDFDYGSRAPFHEVATSGGRMAMVGE